MELKIGADPEFFVRDKRTKDYVAAVFVPGDKKAPHKMSSGSIQRDGLAIEVNIDPASTADEFTKNTRATLDAAHKFIPDNLEPVYEPSVYFNEDYYDSLDTKIKELGCDRDWNATTLRMNPIPQAKKYSKGYLRTGAGHLHLGWTSDMDTQSLDHIYDCAQIVKRLDAYFGQYRFLWDKDDMRPMMYGATGAFRPKSYGLEYRVPSNAWLNHPELWPWLFESCQYVFKSVLEKPTSFNSHPRSIYELWYHPFGRRPTAAEQRDRIVNISKAQFGLAGTPVFPKIDLIENHLFRR